jgi:DNA-binding NtrC family response regulator
MDGLALLAQLQERHAEVPVLLITGHSDHQLAIRALRGGAYDYILKPIDRDDFIAALHRALHTHQLRQQIEEQQRALERYALSLERLVDQRTRELAAANTARETLLRDFIAGLRSPLASLQTLAQKISQSLPQGEEMKPILDDMARLQQSVRQMDEVVREVESSLNAQEFA